ncbi:fasciclin domain-containing protein [Gramella sp. GC03-9]|uniref:Fasciclin domain-containing protein n=1 Tax=Christiangramia oceanisediminis TaxID=2920386 RepID=A0A9X2IA49_9FLAO|nr:fasciclin domain-containing protein [Gramella oceanisediminis]MCP9199613.1 fasciclin domain-containing protein [Gramella oceanisediminis]
MKISTTLFKLSFLAFIFIFASCEKENLSENVTTADASAKASEMANPSPASQQGDATIAEIVIASASEEENPQFTKLLAALVATDLAGVFAGEDNYTVFAPTDEAFDAVLGSDFDYENIDEDTKAILTDVLLYHVTDGRRFSNSVVPKRNSREIETLLGSSFYVYPDLTIDAIGSEANIVTANIAASNGVIHVIDTVLLPTE